MNNANIEKANHLAGVPCYCSSVSEQSRCDFCTGLARVSGARWEDGIKEIKQSNQEKKPKMKTYMAFAEITEASCLHGTPAGRYAIMSPSFSVARQAVQCWLDVDHERKDHKAKRAPRGAGQKVTDGDWTYWIEEKN